MSRVSVPPSLSKSRFVRQWLKSRECCRKRIRWIAYGIQGFGQPDQWFQARRNDRHCGQAFRWQDQLGHEHRGEHKRFLEICLQKLAKEVGVQLGNGRDLACHEVDLRSGKSEHE